MKVLILNDTSNYHNGCKQVMNFIYSKMENYEVVSFSIKNIRSNENLLKDIDVLIINGEGTMHDNAIRAEELLSVGKLAKKSYNIKTFLINSVWQRNNRRVTKDYLRYFDYISVREIFSKNEIKKYIDKDVIINLDLSYYAEVPFKQFPKKKIICGNYWNHRRGEGLIKGVGEDGYIDIFNESWEDIVNKLRNCKVLITGRHHEMYAACKARCLFIVVEDKRNTHKNMGLFKTFNVNIPCVKISDSKKKTLKLIRNCITSYKKYKKEYEKLFNLMESYKLPDFYEKF